ncbi:Late embryogenesis abundant (LEA) hydroxyproline-rich glycoprotein family [Forsythia ovata]|uniref:Late embryogenesis abundant (LEA) hydroxyproline-rich glycoprotein family n=1 Tax=Forsythia ovata TaxID=205694 RepID=A0ABD1X6K9_9LAMI
MAHPATTPRRRHASPVQKGCIAMVLLALVVLVGLSVFIFWLAVKPKELRYSIKDASIHVHNNTKEDIYANFNFTLLAYNPNGRISVYHDKFKIIVSSEYQTMFIDNVNIYPFYQPRRNVTDLHFVVKDFVFHGAEKPSRYAIFEVKVSEKIRLKVGVFKYHQTFRILCSDLMVPLSSSGGFQSVLCDRDL